MPANEVHITSEEVNFLIYRYLQESGFVHSAFTFAYEGQLMKSELASAELPPGALIAYLQKGLQYVSIESQLHEDGTESKNEGEVSLMSSHVVAINGWSGPKTESGKSSSRKRGTPKTSQNNSADSSGAGASGSSTSRVVNTAGGKRQKNGSSQQAAAASAASQKQQEEKVDAIPESDVSVLTSHKSEVFICAWNPQCDLLASGSGDSTARIWSIPPGRCSKLVGRRSRRRRWSSSTATPQ
jgi:transducin (beta)-like 1